MRFVQHYTNLAAFQADVKAQLSNFEGMISDVLGSVCASPISIPSVVTHSSMAFVERRFLLHEMGLKSILGEMRNLRNELDAVTFAMNVAGDADVSRAVTAVYATGNAGLTAIGNMMQHQVECCRNRARGGDVFVVHWSCMWACIVHVSIVGT